MVRTQVGKQEDSQQPHSIRVCKVLGTIGVIRLFCSRELRFPTLLFLFVGAGLPPDIYISIFIQIASCGIAKTNYLCYNIDTYSEKSFTHHFNTLRLIIRCNVNYDFS